jgi:hypothetical protein
VLDDPQGVYAPHNPKPQEYDFRTEFWRQAPDMRPTEGRQGVATLNICRYQNGRHEYPPQEWCPHYRHEDETGKRVRPDWTAQEE